MRSVGLLVFAVVVSCGTTTKGTEPWVLEDEPVHLPSLVGGWHLFKGYEVTADGPLVGTPAEAFLKLVAVRDGDAHILRTPYDFQGLVRLSDTNDALAFVRLFSNNETFYLFGDNGFVEVAATDSNERGFAELPRAEFDRLGLYAPRVQVAPGGFVIRRCLARGTGGARGDVYGVEERVSTDGRYSATRVLMVRDVEILLPGFW